MADSSSNPGAMAGVMGGGGTASVDPVMASLSADNANAAGNGSLLGMQHKGFTNDNVKMLAAQLAKIGQSGGQAQPGLQQSHSRPMYSPGGGTISTGGR